MSGFESPNFTMIPNDFFDKHLPSMSDAEVKVMCVMLRETFGYQRNSKRISIRNLARATGLSAKGAWNGAEKAIERGLLKKSTDGGVTKWTVIVKDKSVVRGTTQVLNEVLQGVVPSSTPSIKERVKESKDGGAKKTRPRNEMFDALVEVTGTDPKAAGGYIGKTASDLSDYDPEKVRRWYSPGGWWYKVRCRNMDNPQPPTLAGVAKSIAQAAEYERTGGRRPIKLTNVVIA